MSSPVNSAPNLASPAIRPVNAAATAAVPAAESFSTPGLLVAMLNTAERISDLFFTPGKPPLVEINGKLTPAGASRILTVDDTRRIASDLIGNNPHASENLKERGSCDVSYSMPGASRFRVNVFMQRGTCAVVMRVIPAKVPDLESLHLPAELDKIVELRNGIV
jgi:twitching motility protein PilT